MPVVAFRSKAAGEVIMFPDHVKPIFEKAGLVFHDRGAILAADLPKAIVAIEHVIDELASLEVPPQDDDYDNESDEFDKPPAMIAPVAIRTRFYPLISHLKKAADKGVDVHWEPY